MPRLPADIRISLKRRGGPAHHIELVQQPVGRRYRSDGTASTRPECQKPLRLRSPSASGVGWLRTPKPHGNPSKSRLFGRSRHADSRPPGCPTSTAVCLWGDMLKASNKRSIDAILLYDESENDVWHDDHHTVSAGEERCVGLA